MNIKMNDNIPRGIFWVLIDLVLIAILFNIIFFVMPALKNWGDSFTPSRLLTVSATGKTTVVPDIAILMFSVISRGTDPAKIADESNEKINAVINFIKSQGVDAKDIKTSGYNLSPDYKYDPETERRFITGYTLRHSSTLKIRDFSKIAPIMAKLPALGVNEINDIIFTVDDPDKVLGEARAEGLKKAKEKAAAIAKESGVRLLKIINIGEFGNFPPPIPLFRKEGALGIGGGGDVGTIPTIEPGTEELQVQVSITYVIE